MKIRKKTNRMMLLMKMRGGGRMAHGISNATYARAHVAIASTVD